MRITSKLLSTHGCKPQFYFLSIILHHYCYSFMLFMCAFFGLSAIVSISMVSLHAMINNSIPVNLCLHKQQNP